MSLEEIISLFSVYVWSYIEDDYKLELLKEYDKRVNEGKPVKIELDGNSVIKINGKIHIKTALSAWILFAYIHQLLVCDQKYMSHLH